jgi:uncharacterized protein YdaU (DUF1376 family)
VHYYPHHIGDFIADTARLSDSQCMAYLRLIWRYYDTERPLDNDPESLAFTIGASVQDVNLILKHYFILDGDVWRKTRCDAVIFEYHGKADKARKSAEARWNNAKAKQSKSECNANASPENANEPEIDANQKPITKNQEPIKELKPSIPKNKFSDEDLKCAEWLAGKLKEQIPDCKSPNLNGWAKSVRDMRELDNRDHKEICQLWLWCRKDSFEAANVQSPEKLRKRYDQLKTKMKSPAVGGSYAGQPKPSLIDRFIATNYGSGSQDDYGSMGGDDSVIRGEVVEPVRGDAGRIGAMAPDIIGDFKATGGGCP